jgi:hypothetical protein
MFDLKIDYERQLIGQIYKFVSCEYFLLSRGRITQFIPGKYEEMRKTSLHQTRVAIFLSPLMCLFVFTNLRTNFDIK